MDFFVMSQNKRIYEYPVHSHELWEILLNIEGSGTAVINDVPYEFHPGTIFCIRPGILHGKKSEEGFVDGSVLIRDFCFKSEDADVLAFNDDDRQSFYSLFKVALEYPMNPATDLFAERFLRSVVDAMQNLLSHWKQTQLLNPEVLRVQKIMASHVEDSSFDIDAVVRSTSYSPNHFRKLFKEQCGCAPLQYFYQMKIQMAKRLILQNKSINTIGEIAHMCGFEDPYYFSRVFKKVEGISPMQFYHESSRKVAEEEGQFHYYLFDLDGTLTDPGEGITNSVMYALRKFGIEPPEREQLYKFIGPPLYESFMKYYGFSEEDAYRAVEYYREYFRPKGIKENRLYDGVKQELEELKSMGRTVALATSKPEEFSVQILQDFDLYKYFDFIGAATMDGSRVRKSDIIAYVIDGLGITDRSRVLMIGDRQQDVEGAHANGIACAGVLYGYGDYDELSGAGADYILEAPRGLSRL